LLNGFHCLYSFLEISVGMFVECMVGAVALLTQLAAFCVMAP
jgi:hypothetical protein